MLRARIIPYLLIRDNGLVKTVKFADAKYVGDPINAVRIFNEKNVDELALIDIDATVKGRDPDLDLLKKIAAESRMPLCYGGGIKNADQAKCIINLGIEKVAISSLAMEDPSSMKGIVEAVGRQSVVVVLDVKKTGLFGTYEIYTHNGKKRTGIKVLDFVNILNEIGIGEVVLNSIDRDGTGIGYDHQIVGDVRRIVRSPMSILGGAGSYSDLQDAIERYGVIGVAAGSLFVFKGKYRAVLIQYPNEADKKSILSDTYSRNCSQLVK